MRTFYTLYFMFDQLENKTYSNSFLMFTQGNTGLVAIILSKSTNYRDGDQSKIMQFSGREGGGREEEFGLSIFQEKRIKSK